MDVRVVHQARHIQTSICNDAEAAIVAHLSGFRQPGVTTSTGIAFNCTLFTSRSAAQVAGSLTAVINQHCEPSIILLIFGLDSRNLLSQPS
jgi:hypothetical protein